MNTQTALRTLRAANPVTNASSSLDADAERERARILATSASTEQRMPVGRHRRPVRRLALAGGALAALTALALVVPSVVPQLGGQAPVAYAATPDPLRVLGPDAYAESGLTAGAPAADLLHHIAERTAGLADDSGTGRYAKIRTEGWSLWTRVDGERVTSEVVPETITS